MPRRLITASRQAIQLLIPHGSWCPVVYRHKARDNRNDGAGNKGTDYCIKGADTRKKGADTRKKGTDTRKKGSGARTYYLERRNIVEARSGGAVQRQAQRHCFAVD